MIDPSILAMFDSLSRMVNTDKIVVYDKTEMFAE